MVEVEVNKNVLLVAPRRVSKEPTKITAAVNGQKPAEVWTIHILNQQPNDIIKGF